MTELTPKPKRRRGPSGRTIGGVPFGFEQQVWRNVPPPEEALHRARPDAPIAGADGTMVTIEMPPDALGGTLGAVETDVMEEPGR